MRLILTAVIFLAGLFDLMIGIGFLLQPEVSGWSFSLVPQGPAGLAVLRGDFFAFFCIAAACMMWGAWRRNGDLLLVPAALFGLAFTGRLISVFVDGAVPGFAIPMAVELFHVVLMLVAWRFLPHHRIEEITG